MSRSHIRVDVNTRTTVLWSARQIPLGVPLPSYGPPSIFEKLKTRKTAMGATLLDIIQSGVENLDSDVGLCAPDAESHTLFAGLFNPVIEDYHGGFKATDKHPLTNFGDLSTLANVDPDDQFVVSTGVRCGRSLQGYPFNPCMTEAQYREREEKVRSTLRMLEGELKVTYYPLDKTQQQLIDDHFLFKEGARFLQAAIAAIKTTKTHLRSVCRYTHEKHFTGKSFKLTTLALQLPEQTLIKIFS
ncbi:arginine kinase Pro c 2.0101-like [Ixodes scapularis]|uniref:arginine kinase Pro c 2.0101-like n=1 Tax=Ixodes scapularis TaxID=6945 RepID=UPI001A9F03F3|nr:arginine kinase Pro c 2.0101-like [Ixodes scapularis]